MAQSILMTKIDKRAEEDVEGDGLMVSRMRVTALIMEHQGVAGQCWRECDCRGERCEDCLTLSHHQLDTVRPGHGGDTRVVGRVAQGEAGDEEVAGAGPAQLLRLQGDPRPVLGREDLPVPGPVEGGGRGGGVGGGAVEGDGAALGHILDPGPLYLGLHCPPVGGGVLHDHQPGLLHLQPHAVADLRQRVHAALVAPAVRQLSLVDYQRPVRGVNLRPGHRGQDYSHSQHQSQRGFVCAAPPLFTLREIFLFLSTL